MATVFTGRQRLSRVKRGRLVGVTEEQQLISISSYAYHAVQTVNGAANICNGEQARLLRIIVLYSAAHDTSKASSRASSKLTRRN